jgi:phosphoribosylformylglycinamidine cyclo-ligase
MRYRDAGVDVSRAEAVKRAMADAVRSTWHGGVREIPGGFAGVTAFPADGTTLLAATMDGVGTKLHLAMEAGRVGDAAADLVYHCANDLLVHGGRPLAFLDYVAQARLDPAVVLAVVEGLSRACGQVGAALLGGETAEMPDTYLDGVVDVAGCMIGVVAAAELLDGRAVAPGDRLLGLGSSGLHTNGFSLARKVVAQSGLGLGDPLPGGKGESIGAALLAPHRWYGPALRDAIVVGRAHALAHVTGGGIAGNLVRVLPEGRRARVHANAWKRPPVFEWLVRAGRIPEDDAREAFNLGIGMVVVCSPEEVEGLARDLERAGETVVSLGEVVAGERGVEWVEG